MRVIKGVFMQSGSFKLFLSCRSEAYTPLRLDISFTQP
jgi:hypothetical protein